MSDEYKAAQAALVSSHIAKQDIVITTALIPGRAAPVLVTEEMARSMRPGSVIVDLAVAQGGNCPLSKPDECVELNGVRVMGFTKLPARLPRMRSQGVISGKTKNISPSGALIECACGDPILPPETLALTIKGASHSFAQTSARVAWSNVRGFRHDSLICWIGVRFIG